MPQIQLLDGKKITFAKSINGLELTKKISKSLEKTALIIEVGNVPKVTSGSFTIAIVLFIDISVCARKRTRTSTGLTPQDP